MGTHVQDTLPTHMRHSSSPVHLSLARWTLRCCGLHSNGWAFLAHASVPAHPPCSGTSRWGCWGPTGARCSSWCSRTPPGQRTRWAAGLQLPKGLLMMHAQPGSHVSRRHVEAYDAPGLQLKVLAPVPWTYRTRYPMGHGVARWRARDLACFFLSYRSVLDLKVCRLATRRASRWSPSAWPTQPTATTAGAGCSAGMYGARARSRSTTQQQAPGSDFGSDICNVHLQYVQSHGM